MSTLTLHYRDWTFEVNRELTQKTYAAVAGSGADTCVCNDCQNYVAYRDHIFPSELITLLVNLGIDYRKEVEVIRKEVEVIRLVPKLAKMKKGHAARSAASRVAQ